MDQTERIGWLFTKDGVWKWLRPGKLIDSNWSDTNLRLPDAQRTDRYPDSILDFIFVAGPAQQWQAKSWVVVKPGDFPDSGETSDHRPVAAVVELSVGQYWSRSVLPAALAGMSPQL